MFRYRVFLGCTLASALAACGGGSGSTAGGTTAGGVVPLGQARQALTQMLTPDGSSGASIQRLYVQGPQDIYVYSLTGTTPTAKIKNFNRAELPATIAVSPVSGDLYVGKGPTSEVAYYGAAGEKLLGTLTGLTLPFGLTFDRSGNLYVVNGVSSNIISVYAPGSSTASYTIPVSQDTAIPPAVDAANNLYVVNGGGNYTNSINVYAQGSSTPTYSITSGLSSLDVFSMTADQSGNVYVGNMGIGSPGSVVVYTHGSTTPSYTITNGAAYPYVLRVDAKGNLYVGNFLQETATSSVSSVSVYAPGATAPTYTINGNGASPNSFAFAPPATQNLYVGGFADNVGSYAAGTGSPIGSVDVPGGVEWITIGK